MEMYADSWQHSGFVFCLLDVWCWAQGF